MNHAADEYTHRLTAIAAMLHLTWHNFTKVSDTANSDWISIVSFGRAILYITHEYHNVHCIYIVHQIILLNKDTNTGANWWRM